MRLGLHELMPDAARAALAGARFSEYEARAEAFLRHRTGWLLHGVGATDLQRLIGQAYDLSRKAGLRNEADHLKYLYAAAYWGIGFETDPQYAAPLRAAGYRPADGSRAAVLPIEPALKSLARWQDPLRDELAHPLNVTERLLDIAEGPRPDPLRLQSAMAAIWPARATRLGPDGMAACIGAAMAEHARPEAVRNGQAVYAALALYLGVAFLRDPLQPWAPDAAMDGLALVQGVIDYWMRFDQVIS